MDRHRRRFVPSSDGLEDRQLLSTATATPTAAAVSTADPTAMTTTTTAPVDTSAAGQTIAVKLQRIQGLPFFLGQLNRDNAVAQPATQNIQNDLNSMVAQLNKANPSTLSTFNLALRKAQPYQKIRPQDAAALNEDFGEVLTSAGAKPAVVADLQKQMTALTNFATTQPNSRIVATNNYSLVLQLALDTGRPLSAPTAAPSLTAADHKGNSGKVQLTTNTRPTLTGDYIVGTGVQIVDPGAKTVLGTGTVDPSTGTYTVKFNDHLPAGTYSVRVRGVDGLFVSPPSKLLTFEIRTPPKA